MQETLTLFELNGLVRQTIEHTLNREYWVEAELSECRESRGHCYMELVQKDAFSNTPVARAQAKCWRNQWTAIAPRFERVTGQVLHAGMKVRLRVYAQFHEAYGFSWIVSDIDPNYTLGDLARRRQEIVRQLKAEGIFDLQKELALPLFCLRVAVVSSATAAGYGDFQKQLEASPVRFTTELFPAIMQGEQVEQSIVAALDAVNARIDDFDCVVIIRGGGATADMSGFDTLMLAENVAQFPLPVITGIGHDRDECVLDMVSFLRVKTPTAAAQHLAAHAEEVLRRVDQAGQDIVRYAQGKLQRLQLRLDAIAEALPRLFTIVRGRQEARLERMQQTIVSAVGHRIEMERHRVENAWTQIAALTVQSTMREKHRLDLTAEKLALLDPALLLRRGYSITLYNGKALRDPESVAKGSTIETRVEKGIIKSVTI